MRKLFTIVLLLGFTLWVQAAAPGGHKVEFKINGLRDSTVYVAHHYGDKQYIDDTLKLDASGYTVWQGDTAMPGGIYLFVLPGSRYFEFIMTEQIFSLETAENDPVMSMKVKNSEENRVFYEYLRAIDAFQKRAKPIQDNMAAHKGQPEEQKYADELKALEDEMTGMKRDFMKKNPTAFISKVIAASEPPTLPKPAPGTQPDQKADYLFYKSHFWDKYDFTDQRFLYTPVYTAKVKEYMDRLTPQDPDSVIIACDYLIRKAEVNKEMYRFTVITLFNKYVSAKYMCWDKIYVHLGEKYYMSGKAWWADTSQTNKITDRVLKMKYNSCGLTAQELKLQDTLNKVQSLHSMKQKYTLVVFWEYDCSHCQKDLPELKKWYDEYRKYDIGIYAVCTKPSIDRAKWTEFIRKHNLDWINVHDSEHRSNFRFFYDIYSTPVIYILDENKQIIGKRVDVANLKKFMDVRLGLAKPDNKQIKMED